MVFRIQFTIYERPDENRLLLLVLVCLKHSALYKAFIPPFTSEVASTLLLLLVVFDDVIVVDVIGFGVDVIGFGVCVAVGSVVGVGVDVTSFLLPSATAVAGERLSPDRDDNQAWQLAVAKDSEEKKKKTKSR